MFIPEQQQYEDYETIRLLKEAMAAEKMAARDYELLIAATENQEGGIWLGHILNVEKRHFLLLEDIYQDLTGENYPIKNSPASMPREYPEMLKTSICDELEAVAFYEKLAPRLLCLRHKEIIWRILNDEKEHARTLAGIYSQWH